jgi:hypothetical protein
MSFASRLHLPGEENRQAEDTWLGRKRLIPATKWLEEAKRNIGGHLCLRGGRSAEEIARQLASFEGILQVDGYAAYKAHARSARREVTLAFCFAHARRKFVQVHKTTGSRFAADVIERLAEVYAIEARIRGKSAAHAPSGRSPGGDEADPGQARKEDEGHLAHGVAPVEAGRGMPLYARPLGRTEPLPR